MPDSRLDTYEERSTAPIAAATLLVIPALLLEGSTDPVWAGIGLACNWISWVALAGHVVTLLAIGGLREGFRRGWLDLLLVLATIPLAPLPFGAARMIRLVRVLRMGFAIVVAVRHFRAVLQHRQFHFVVLVAIVAVGLGGVGIYSVEGGENARIRSVGDGLWWAIVTATTVGYGDISPQTTEGRVIAVGLMLLGIGVIGAFTATIASFFVTQGEDTGRDDLEARLPRLEAKIDRLLAARERGPGDAGPPPS